MSSCPNESRGALKEERAMLVLSRKLGQRFQVGPEVRITIVKIDRNSVRIGIEAPSDVTVYREEIVIAAEEPSFKADAA
ncbi:MAG TPA: carbon storage regulator [Isosphaeraceae bacterium]|nr:carbon storage regulator [Isosphaeraceae bacterium]